MTELNQNNLSVTPSAKREASNAGMTSKEHPNPIEVFAVHEEMILQMTKTTKNKLKLARKSLH